ncbi:transcription factor PAP1-domain-containing protein [Kalaharituber pfeilii]|nr:transcription factor PAP1-domain-containing protein [Kalaharituber pfeilii]
MTSVNSHLYLDPEQQDLLLAALATNPTPMYSQLQYIHSLDGIDFTNSSKTQQKQSAAPAPTQPLNEIDMTHTSSVIDYSTPLDGLNGVSPVVDNLDYSFDLDGSYDYDLSMGGEFGTSVEDTTLESPITVEHEKRKTPPGVTASTDPQGTEPKRREKETEDKVPKKPGRKPLTSEPTSKRKAQNRAAQRAFRERKEKHLKDLEQKVADLEKASEAANKENSALKQHIERLQTELNEYRKRLNESKSGFNNLLAKGSNGGFQFEFPLFGPTPPGRLGLARPGQSGQMNGAASNSGMNTDSQTGRTRSLTTPSSSTSAILPPSGVSSAAGSSRFTSTPQTTQDNTSTAFSSYYTPITRVGRSTRESTSEFASEGHRDTPSSHKVESSPSASSVSHHGTNSSMTSPESNSHSPLSYKQEQLESVTEEIGQVISSDHDEPGYHCGVLDDGEASFCEKLGAIVCGNPRNPAPLDPDSKLLPNLNEIIPRPDPSIARSNNNIANNTISQVNSAYDPVLFGDYRDSTDQANLDLNMSFFDAAFPMADFSLGSPIISGSPVNENVEPEVKKPVKVSGLDSPEDDNSSSEDEEVRVTSKADANLLTCNKIWDRINSHPKFLSGELDMDNLCAELKSKAKCSETGVVVGQKDVEEVLSKVGSKICDNNLQK